MEGDRVGAWEERKIDRLILSIGSVFQSWNPKSGTKSK